VAERQPAMATGVPSGLTILIIWTGLSSTLKHGTGSLAESPSMRRPVGYSFRHGSSIAADSVGRRLSRPVASMVPSIGGASCQIEQRYIKNLECRHFKYILDESGNQSS
jgi:hypothetical protein